MKKIFAEYVTTAQFEEGRGSASPVSIEIYTEAWYDIKRCALVIEHECHVTGGGSPSYLDSKVRDRMVKESKMPTKEVLRGFFVRHLKTVPTKAEAIRLAVKSADDYGTMMTNRAEEVWEAVEAEQDAIQERIREIQARK